MGRRGRCSVRRGDHHLRAGPYPGSCARRTSAGVLNWRLEDCEKSRVLEKSVLRALAENPDYATNAQLRAYLARIDGILSRCGADADDIVRIQTFCGMMGEMLGHLWSPILDEQRDSVTFAECLMRVAHHCALAMSEQSGLPFYSTASICFADALSETEPPSASEDISLCVRGFSARVLGSLVSRELQDSFVQWTERATARYLTLLNDTSDSGVTHFLTDLALCYAANVHVMAVAIEMWLHLQTRRNEQ